MKLVAIAAIAAFAFVGLAVAQTVHTIPTKEVQLVGEIPAEWWTFVELQDTPAMEYTVPIDRRLVVAFATYYGTILVNGTNANPRLAPVFSNPVPANVRVVLEPGDRLVCAPGNAQLWGYLEPVR